MPEAVILGGGQGECLRQGDDYIPKLLTRVGSKLLLERHIDRLKDAGLTSATLCLSLKADAVRSRFGDGSRWGMRLRYHVEEQPLGTAGAVKTLGAASLPEDILILSGDAAVDTDLKSMFQFHASHRAPATIAAVGARHGLAASWMTVGPAQRIVGFPLSPPNGQACLAVGNLWIIRRSLLHLVPDGRPSDFLLDVFPAALKLGEPLVAYLEAGSGADHATRKPSKKNLSGNLTKS